MKISSSRTHFLLFGAILLVAPLCFILFFLNEKSVSGPSRVDSDKEKRKISRSRDLNDGGNNPDSSPRKGLRSLRLTMDEYKEMFNSPVEVYGVVVDQFDDPVVGAKVKCYVPPIGSMDSPLELISSDPDGEFEIKGITAFTIIVTVDPPDGYDMTPETNRDIVIAKAPERILRSVEFKKLSQNKKKIVEPIVGRVSELRADKKQPEVFRLKKKERR